MSRFKIFLLGLIVSLLCIVSFTNAETFNFIWDGSSYSPSTFTTEIPIKDYDWDSLNFVCTNTASDGCGFRFYVGTKSKCTIENHIYSDGHTSFTNTCSSLDLAGTFALKTGPVNGHFDSLSFSDGVSDEPEGFNVMNNLTPAIEGLHDTVKELIPYVVYIGIGVLLFMLGFIVIRRLVIWMLGKFNSIFISKKR